MLAISKKTATFACNNKACCNSGALLIWLQWDYLYDQVWLYLKVGIVGLLVWYHFYCGHLVKVFAEGKNNRNHVFYRWFNEVPVFGLLGAVILVVVRPFS